MKTKLAALFIVGLSVWLPATQAQNTSEPAAPVDLAAAAPAETAPAAEVLPLVVFEDAPLTDTVKTLARQAGINLIFDPKVTATGVGADGKPLSQPNVSIRFENVTAEQALEALLANHNLIMTRDAKTKIARVSLKDANNQEPLLTHVVHLKYSNPTNVASMIIASHAKSKVFADMRTSQLVVTATEKDHESISNLVSHIDSSVDQVLIEARFFETTKNPKSVKGIDWSGTTGGQTVTFGNGLTSAESTTTSPGTPTTTTLPSGRVVTTTPSSSTTTEQTTVLNPSTGGLSLNTARGFDPNTAFLNADGVKAVLHFLNTDNDTESIATPRAIALDGQPTELSVVRNIPVFEEEQGQVSGSGSQQPNTVKPNYELLVGDTVLNEVGIKLIVTPRIAGDTNVFLDLRPEISIVEAQPERKTLGGRVNEAPIFARRKVITQAIVPSGNTLVLGGLNSDESTKSYTKVPLLGDLPAIGLLFRKDEKGRNKRSLIIFVTPTIINDRDFQENLNSRDFLQHKMKPEKPDDESAWDTGKPHDWTKPVY